MMMTERRLEKVPLDNRKMKNQIKNYQLPSILVPLTWMLTYCGDHFRMSTYVYQVIMMYTLDQYNVVSIISP